MVSAALAALAFLAVPAAAQPSDAARMEAVAAEAGRWAEQLNSALAAGSEGFDALNRKVQGLFATAVTREKVAAAAPEIRRLIARNRENARRSDAMLAALPAYPSAMPTDIPAERLVAEARAQNARLIELLGHYEAVVVAMAAGDIAALNRSRPKLAQGVFALLGQQGLMFRNRQASVPATVSSHQALGIAAQIYRAMVAVAHRGLAAREGGAAAEAAAAALRSELGMVARDTRALAAAGRINLKRELAEFEALRKRPTRDGAQARLAGLAIAATLAEEKSFEIGDRLAAFADSNSALTAAQLGGGAGARPLLTALATLESDYIDSALNQPALAGDGPK